MILISEQMTPHITPTTNDTTKDPTIANDPTVSHIYELTVSWQNIYKYPSVKADTLLNVADLSIIGTCFR